MPQTLVARLSAALSAQLAAPDLTDAYKNAHKVYFEDPKNKANQETLLSIITANAQTMEPLEGVLCEAWKEGLALASSNGLIQPQNDGASYTNFDYSWAMLAQSGWAELSDRQKQDLSESLAKSVLGALFDCGARPEGVAEDIAARTLVDIAAGDIPLCRGGGESFTNWADGRHLDIEMKNWHPMLSDHGETPQSDPVGEIFTTRIEIVSGRVLVADSVRIDPAPQMLSELRDILHLDINYGWHRVMRTAQTANCFNMVDIAMGDDGPGLVRAPGSDTIFAGYESEAFPEIANVCHDYWGTVMIDREKLVRAMIAKEVVTDAEAAEVEIDAWLEASDFHSEVQMTPGTWHFYWDDDRETLDAELCAAGVDAPEDTRFVLSREPLPIAAEKLNDMSLPEDDV